MYIPLNVVTDYSFLSSLIKIKDLIKFAKGENIKCIGICDNNLSYVMEFYNECIKNDIKPLVGYSFYLNDKKINLFAKNYKGYQNLCYISSNEKTLDLIKNNIEGLFCVLEEESIELYDELNIPDTYIGYKDKKLSNYKNVLFNEIRCFNEEDVEYLNYLTYIKENKKIEDEIVKYENVSFIKEKDLSLDKQDYEVFDEIYNMVDLKIEKKDLLPKYNSDINFDENRYLEELCKKGLLKRLDNKVSKKYVERLMKELSIIKKMGFSNYFLIVWDYVKFAKKNGILVGSGRGSAVGSLVSYSLGITDIDPLKYNLVFERFLNPERVTMPDIDIDFESGRRSDVINYVISKYTSKKVSNIVSFNLMKSRMVLRDVARIFSMENRIDLYIRKFDRKLSIMENMNNPEIKKMYDSDLMISRITDIAIRLEELKRGRGIHAAGIIISKEELDRYVPIIKADGVNICGFEKDYPESLGLLKMDILAVDNLTFISDVLKDIGSLNINKIPLDDKKTLDIFYNVDTDGIFQFETPTLKNILRKIKVDSFNDLISLLALDRPGAINNVDLYAMRKDGKEKITYIHNDLEGILKDTYGIILYQEQIMQIASLMASFSLGEADILRRAMSKKKTDLMLKEKEKFINNSIKNGYDIEVSEKVFDYICPFAEYGFNKSHSVGYAMFSYQMAYLKANYRLYFMKNILNKSMNDMNKVKRYINDCKLNNIEILKPDINLSTNDFIIENNRIRYSLSMINNVNSTISLSIINERKNGLYKDIFDFVSRTYDKGITSNILKELIYSGCFSSFNYNKKTLINNLDLIINYAELCKDLSSSIVPKPEIIVCEEYDKDELINIELSTFGFYLSNHPVQNKRDNNITTKNIKDYFNKIVDIYLLIDNKREIATKNQERMVFLTGSDEYSSIELVLFPKVYENNYNITKGDVFKVNGRVERRNGSYQIIVNNMKKL